MSRSHNEDRFSDDLQEVADVLRDRRPALTALELDRIKLRAMSATRRSTSPRKGFFMRSRLTTALTIGFLALGTGGAMALYGGGGDLGFGGDGGSASFHQYRECDHGNGRGKDHECHGHEGDGGGGDKGGGKGDGGNGGGGDHGHGHGHGDHGAHNH